MDKYLRKTLDLKVIEIVVRGSPKQEATSSPLNSETARNQSTAPLGVYEC